MPEKSATSVSPTRLRVGVVLLVLWMLPFWWAGPAVADLLGFNSPKASSAITFVIIAVQTILGVIGAIVAGKQITTMVKGTSLKKLPRKVIKILWTGEVKDD